ncbi:pentapeptide repeat-containing protein [Saccharopolyspora spinosa]|uniref:Uncharacterized protein YjbI with pentapeptide repeats n=1 Tax=Saccharopolyspora spinosa TaxID=60894 RepID=A0A2N3Y6C2_SACSN|nr:pentapeptide repeat-containing protein [Saccharopolyspora spinosa]PKW18460.1 uncharacterized protein YjbI with pentapeptide repeats [Saccharopolyspora spinosa]
MDFRDLGNRRSIQRPSIEIDDLTADDFTFHGEFDGDELLIDSSEFADVKGEGKLTGSLVRSTDLSRSHLSPLKLSDVRFEYVDLSSASWQGVKLHRAEIVRSRAMGFRISLASAQDVYIDGCRWDYATIHIEGVKGALVFNECLFREATITGDLSNVVFRDCDLGGVEFEANKAMNCDLTTSRVDEVARGLLGLRGARITAEQAASAAILIATEAGLTVTD